MRILRRWFARTGAALVLLGIATGMGLLAVAFLCAALYLALQEVLGAPLAALVIAGGLVFVAALLVLSIKVFVLRPGRPGPEPTQPDGRAAAAKLGEMLGEEAGAWTKQHPGMAMVAALAAGFVVGTSPKIRAILLSLLR
jgi:hypothetical protein